MKNENGKGRVFQTVYETFTVPKTLVDKLGEALPGMLELLLNRVYREFFAEFERMSLDLSTFDEGGDTVTVDLERNLGVSRSTVTDEDRFHYPPRAAVTSVRLSTTRYETLAESLRQMLSEAPDEDGGDLCTFAVQCYRGGSLR